MAEQMTCKEAAKAWFEQNPQSTIGGTDLTRRIQFHRSSVTRVLAELRDEGFIANTGRGWRKATRTNEEDLGQPQYLWQTPGQWRDLNPDPHQENARKLFEEDQPRQRDGFKVVHYETMTEQDRKRQDIFPYVDRLNSIDQHIRTLEAERLEVRTILQAFRRKPLD